MVQETLKAEMATPADDCFSDELKFDKDN